MCSVLLLAQVFVVSRPCASHKGRIEVEHESPSLWNSYNYD